MRQTCMHTNCDWIRMYMKRIMFNNACTIIHKYSTIYNFFYPQTHKRTLTHTDTYAHSQTLTHTDTYAHSHTHTHTHSHTDTYANQQANKHKPCLKKDITHTSSEHISYSVRTQKRALLHSYNNGYQ